MGYNPQYAEGKVLVYKNDNCRDDFFKTLVSLDGCIKIKKWIHEENAYICDVNPGNEEEFIKKLMNSNSYITSAERIDVKKLNRITSLDDLIEKIKDLQENCELDDVEYNSELDELIRDIFNKKR